MTGKLPGGAWQRVNIKNEGQFAATWMDLEVIILSEVKSDTEREISYDITCMWNLKYDTNELTYKTETDSQTYETNLWLPKGKGGREKLGV